jgi:hypothetical protein
MFDKFKSVELVFENCNIVEIPKEYVESFHFWGITESLGSCNQDEVTFGKAFEEGFVVIKKEALELETWMNKNSSNKSEYATFEYQLYTLRDVTSVCINLENGEEINLYVPCDFERGMHGLNNLKMAIGDAFRSNCIEIRWGDNPARDLEQNRY